MGSAGPKASRAIAYLCPMPRILAIDYGLKRTGIAVTDPFKIIATALTTIESSSLMAFLKSYFQAEDVELILVGEPLNLDGSHTHATEPVRRIIERIRKEFPGKPVQTVDERYTSKMASQAMIDMGLGQKKRREKGLVDQIAATIMLQEYLRGFDR